MQSPLDLKAQDFKDLVFSGTVVNNLSPGLDGRVQIRIPRIFDGIPDADLPWAIPDRMVSPAGTGTPGSATCMIPAVGSKVFVAFQLGNPYDPIYSSDVLNTQFFASTVFGGEYPNAWGFSDGENFIKINRVTGAITIENKDGAAYKILAGGDMEVISNNKNITFNAGTGNIQFTCFNWTVTVAGAATENALGAWTITGNPVVVP